MSLKFFDKLSKDFTDILNDKECYDVAIEVGNEGDKKLFTSHSTILRFRSSYFREKLTKAIIDKSPINIKLDISAEFVEVVLRYVYGGIVDLEDKDNKFIFNLMIASNELKFEELSQQLEIYLIENKASWLRSHFSFVYHSIFKSRNFERLEKFCNNIIVKYPNLIFDAEDFTSLDETTLVPLLKREDLQIDEIEIWKKVIQWGVAKHNNLSSIMEEWTKEDFQALKLTLQHCLPYIRYSQFSQADLWRHIKPYKKLLDNQLWDDLNKRLIFPDEPFTSVILPARSAIVWNIPERTTNPFSTIISYDHVAEISSWVDRKITAYSLKDIPYEFKLILRGRRDGFNPQTFWDMCHNCANTVTILKVSGTNEILGGYNPLAWDKTTQGTWITTNNSFIFSLKNENIQNSILSRVKNTRCAIRNISSSYQNKWGIDFNDLYTHSIKSDFTQDCLSYAGTNDIYEKRIRTAKGHFSIVDYEVFSLVKLENI